ncbi:MAG: hypothetical protein L3K26_16825, partial [Candidatus Hydrogenedentes bacterium]|nr:hypothetical protein [Candidatus Hydrogenedentota bacterium]
VGFQIGIQDVEIILVIRSEKALDAILDYQATLGADAGITIGVFGGGVKGSTTTNMDADIVAFAHSKLGLFGGGRVVLCLRCSGQSEKQKSGGAKKLHGTIMREAAGPRAWLSGAGIIRILPRTLLLLALVAAPRREPEEIELRRPREGSRLRAASPKL